MSETLLEVKRSRRNAPQVVRRLLLILGFLYLLPLVGMFACQRYLVFAGAASRTNSAKIGTDVPAGVQTIQLRTDAGDRVAAYYGHALRADGRLDKNYAHRPTLLFFYGKGSSIAASRTLFQSFRRLDANVLMPDYIGFGQSGGQESEFNCFATARAAYHFLRVQPDIDQKWLVIAGFSLGSGVAIDLAARELTAKQPVAGLALFAAYTSMAEMGHQEYPIYPSFLLRLVLRYPFASDTKMPKIICPVLLVHSRADRLIPYAMSDKLTALCGGPVTRVTVSRADHSEYFSSRETAVYPALRRFLENTHHETQIHRGSPQDRLFSAKLIHAEPR